MNFFLPHGTAGQNSRTWDELRASGHRAVFSVTYEHERGKFVATVGQERQEYRRRTGPRGGYIKDADHLRTARSTGSLLILIVDTGTALEVHSLPPSHPWANPSLIGRSEITSIEYFDAPETGKA